MAGLDVSGAFMLTIGHGEGPEVNVALSIRNDDGTPTVLSLPDPDDSGATWPIRIFTGLSAKYGTAAFPCVVTDVEDVVPPPAGFVGLVVELEHSREVGRLAGLGLGALGVIVEDGSARGQTVITGTGAATAQTWWSERQPDAPKR